jgi:hypothetical protein
MRSLRKSTGYVALALGMAALIVAAGFEVTGMAWRSTAQATTGVVAALAQDPDGGLAPAVRYRVDGREWVWQSHIYAGWGAPFAIGERVPLLYQPTNPCDALIDTFVWGHMGCLMAGGVAILFLAGGRHELAIASRHARLRAEGNRLVAIIPRVSAGSQQRTLDQLATSAAPHTWRSFSRGGPVPNSGRDWQRCSAGGHGAGREMIGSGSPRPLCRSAEVKSWPNHRLAAAAKPVGMPVDRNGPPPS